MIKELTPEHLAMMPEIVTKWVTLACGGDSNLDETNATRLVGECYVAAGLKAPASTIVMDSPHAAVTAAKKLCPQVTNTDGFFLSTDSGWLATFDFFDRIGIVNSDQYKMWRDLTLCGVWDSVFLDDAAFLIRRPTVVKKTGEGAQARLHCVDGPAVAFRDGWALYAWQGQMVPKEWIMAPDTVDPKLGLTHPNGELRRTLCEILGWKKVLDGLNHKVIDKNENPEIGTLIEYTLPEATAPSRFLMVRCPTGRDFVLPVNIECKTALEANAWTYELSVEDFQIEGRS